MTSRIEHRLGSRAAWSETMDLRFEGTARQRYRALLRTVRHGIEAEIVRRALARTLARLCRMFDEDADAARRANGLVGDDPVVIVSIDYRVDGRRIIVHSLDIELELGPDHDPDPDGPPTVPGRQGLMALRRLIERARELARETAEAARRRQRCGRRVPADDEAGRDVPPAQSPRVVHRGPDGAQDSARNLTTARHNAGRVSLFTLIDTALADVHPCVIEDPLTMIDFTEGSVDGLYGALLAEDRLPSIPLFAAATSFQADLEGSLCLADIGAVHVVIDLDSSAMSAVDDGAIERTCNAWIMLFFWAEPLSRTTTTARHRRRRLGTTTEAASLTPSPASGFGDQDTFTTGPAMRGGSPITGIGPNASDAVCEKGRLATTTGSIPTMPASRPELRTP